MPVIFTSEICMPEINTEFLFAATPPPIENTAESRVS